MDPWTYYCEGGKHVIFSPTTPALSGRLLRVARNDLTPTSTFQSECNSLDFLERVVYPLLQPYFDIPEKYHLTTEMARNLRQRAIESGKIPYSRLSSWRPEATAEREDVITREIPATLLFDYRRLPSCELPCWSFEIKPKAGYLAFSPLVDPRHRVKFQQSRFSIQQELVAHGITHKRWTAENVRSSRYNPLDLFSRDHNRVMIALREMLETPQNNLKVWHGNSLLLGHEVCAMTTSQILAMTHLLAKILCDESVLSRILHIQLLDVIDADGAVAIFKHLVCLCDNKKAQAERLLDSLPGEFLVASVEIGCVDASPFPRPVSVPLTRLLDLVENFSPSNSTSLQMDEAYTSAHDLVRELSIKDCIFLLQNWLLSLAMCDVSILIALAPTGKTKIDPSETSQWNSVQLQDEAKPGCLRSKSGELLYTVKAVDCDNKPASKLRDRQEKEALFQQL